MIIKNIVFVKSHTVKFLKTSHNMVNYITTLISNTTVRYNAGLL